MGEFSADASTNGTVDLTLIAGTGVTSSATTTIAFDSVQNPSPSGGPTTFFVRITTYNSTTLDSGNIIDGPSQVSSAVIPVVTVSGTQDAVLSLTVSSVGNAVTVGDGLSGDSKTTDATSTATSLPFGTFNPTGDSRAVAHTINVVTNGGNGYSATVDGGSRRDDAHRWLRYHRLRS